MKAQDPLIGQRIDNYKALKRIGQGGMAVVYLAEDTQLARQVVLKVMLPHVAAEPGMVARFQREAQATARLDHPHIVQIYTIGSLPDERPYLAMQYVPGGALSDNLQRLNRQGQWASPVYALTLAQQVAAALTTAHGAGIVHRDLKPANILLREDGSAVVSDLGIAAVSQAATRLTRTGGILGTPHYMSPEQAAGQPVDGRSDIYSLGVILYELLSGHPPFMADSPLVIVHHQLYEQPQPLEQICPGLSPAIYSVVRTCLQKDPNGRFQTVADLSSALDAVLQSEGGPVTSPTLMAKPAYVQTEVLTPLPLVTEEHQSKTQFLWGLIPLLLLIIAFLAWRAFLPPSNDAESRSTATDQAAATQFIAQENATPTVTATASSTFTPTPSSTATNTSTPAPPTATAEATVSNLPTSIPTLAANPDTNTGNGAISFAVIGDYGSAGQGAKDVAALIHKRQPDFILTVGDNNYPDGAAATIAENITQHYSDYIAQNRFFPTLGNHDYYTANAAPYFEYFDLPDNERYYDFVKGDVHFFALNSDWNEPDGIGSDSIQAQWLQEKLASSETSWQIVYFHVAPYSSREASIVTALRWPFANWGADLVLTGHAHVYERLLVDGIPYITNGIGGHSIYNFDEEPDPRSLARYNADFGALFIEVKPGALNAQFISRAGFIADEFTLFR